MATYYVDLSAATNGDGTEPTPYNALTSLPTLVAGDIVEIEGEGKLNYTVTGSGTANNFIIFRKKTTSTKPTKLMPLTNGSNCFLVTSRSYVKIQNLSFGVEQGWTSQDNIGIYINGGGSNVYLENLNFDGARIQLEGGFTRTNTFINNVKVENCYSDGLRFFSGASGGTWDRLEIINSIFNNNGLANAANGSGINIQILLGHTTSFFKNIKIENCTLNGNTRFGMGVGDNSISGAVIGALANTTPPPRNIQGVHILNNTCIGNLDTGIYVLGLQPGTLYSCLIHKNYCKGNSKNSTTGNIWTGDSLRLVISNNTCIGALTDGTVIGDGQGIFDDQWNDSCVVKNNFISSNLFRPFNPEYSSYGIGIYRATNSLHYGNVIHNCRYGYVIGTVVGSVAPVMANIIIENNTFMDIEKIAFSIWTEVPSNSLTIRKNVILRAARDVEAFTGLAGTQNWSQNYAYNVTTKYTGNNVGSSAWDHTKPITDITKDGFPTLGGNLYRTGTFTNRQTAINGSAYNPPSIGAYEYFSERAVR